ncbi:MAG: hypothetical protein WB460_04105 [Candidatus Acidiferrales bacterium]
MKEPYGEGLASHTGSESCVRGCKAECEALTGGQAGGEARAHGVSVEVYVQEILARQTHETAGEWRLQSVRAAIDRILELRKGNKLAGLRTQDLIHEGHKY